MTVESIANARIDGVGLKPLIAAIPPSWRREAERAVGPVSPRATTLLQVALSTTTISVEIDCRFQLDLRMRRRRVGCHRR